jgi:hypothetical protein
MLLYHLLLTLSVLLKLVPFDNDGVFLTGSGTKLNLVDEIYECVFESHQNFCIDYHNFELVENEI